jgi:hypothetical protein
MTREEKSARESRQEERLRRPVAAKRNRRTEAELVKRAGSRKR